MSAGSAAIVPARGDLDESRVREVREFLSRGLGLNEVATGRWLSELLCLAIEDGRVIGVSVARPASVGLIGSRPFWIYRCVLESHSDELWCEMFNASFALLAKDYEESGGPYIGFCTLIEDPAMIERHPEAIWPDTELLFAGYLADGRQVRLRYFWGAAIAPGLPNSPSLDETRNQDYPLEERYEIVPLQGSRITAEDVIELWMREGAMATIEDAAQRVGEVQLVAVERDGGLAGLSTLYLQWNEQLRMNLWHYRTYVAEPHRMSNIAAQLIFGNRDLLEQRFVSGEDTRSAGMLFELENPGMREYFNKALWLPADFTFIGENDLGAHVRVHYFPGATAPPPDASAG